MLKSALLNIIVILSTIIASANAQQSGSPKAHAFLGTFVFSLESGLTMGYTDYNKSKSAFALRGGGEYYFDTQSDHLFSIKLLLGNINIAGSDERTSISTKDGVREIPPEFKTSIFQLGLAVSYSLSIGDVVFPFLSGGFSNLWFDPKDGQGNKAQGNESGLYSNSAKAFNVDLGLRILVSEQLSLNFMAGAYISLTDYLDDVAASNSNDVYFVGLAGISFSPFLNLDADEDGIKYNEDNCPDTPEDFDGFQDDDGCPDFDNDGDGILDEMDPCLNEAEDYDGYKDEDGCPDPDNDGDGINDVEDECVNDAEDIDGFNDNDGCPDFDNDSDGIPDSIDLCPDEPELINGLFDEDGCPDTVSVQVLPDRFLLQSDEIFFEGSAKIRYEAKSKLDEILQVISQMPDAEWRIEGHMDSYGLQRYIRNLSMERAKAILEYFAVFGGLDRGKFEIFGMGDKFPIGDNKTDAGRRKNRRIEIIKE